MKTGHPLPLLLGALALMSLGLVSCASNNTQDLTPKPPSTVTLDMVGETEWRPYDVPSTAAHDPEVTPQTGRSGLVAARF